VASLISKINLRRRSVSLFVMLIILHKGKGILIKAVKRAGILFTEVFIY
jgi:hypothetical protein